uniref:Coronin n=1 Tax=Amazona collaria TaxID=241587 RepID=A0A8B9G1S9_9PSIT
MRRGEPYHTSKFRHVYGRPASKEKCYDCVPITHNVHDNQFCAVNPHFIAVVTECACGGAFVVIPIHQTGKLDPHYPRIWGHRGNVLDIKWNPFNDFVIASCSEDATVKIWEIPKPLLTKTITSPKKELLGHVRRVGLIEWHPTANNILFSSGYDYKVGLFLKILSAHRDVVLSMSFNTDGSLLATACRDRKIRLIDPRAGTVLQVGWVQRFVVQLISPLGVFPLLGRLIAIKEDLSVPSIAQHTRWCNCLLLFMEYLLSLLNTGFLHLTTILLAP